jgi:hypothetical protein
VTSAQQHYLLAILHRGGGKTRRWLDARDGDAWRHPYPASPDPGRMGEGVARTLAIPRGRLGRSRRVFSSVGRTRSLAWPRDASWYGGSASLGVPAVFSPESLSGKQAGMSRTRLHELRPPQCRLVSSCLAGRLSKFVDYHFSPARGETRTHFPHLDGPCLAPSGSMPPLRTRAKGQ